MRVAKSGRWGLLVLATSWRGLRPDRVLEARLGDWWWSEVPIVARVFPAKSQRFGADDGDACGCRYPLKGVVVATLDALGLQVKTLDLCGLGDGGACCVVTFLKALLRSFGSLSLVVFGGKLDAS